VSDSARKSRRKIKTIVFDDTGPTQETVRPETKPKKRNPPKPNASKKISDESEVSEKTNRRLKTIVLPKRRYLSDVARSNISQSRIDRLNSPEFRKEVWLRTLEGFKQVHGDRYDYSKVEYVKYNTKIKIICKEHGEFEQTPKDHKKGHGCKECANELLRGRPKKTKHNTETTIERFTKIHGDRYDYSKVDYQGAGSKVLIICREHGEFLQRVSDHAGGANCPKCSGHYQRTLLELLDTFKEVHGDLYDYSKVNLDITKKGRDSGDLSFSVDGKVTIICKEHGEFRQRAFSHMKGSGCKKCAIEKTARIRIEKTRDSILTRFKEVHGDRYDYSKVDYQGSRNKVVIICKEHGEFLKRPVEHIRGAGCPKCGQKSG
jgi:hypothetical protein